MNNKNVYKDMELLSVTKCYLSAIPSVTGITVTVLYMKQGMQF